MRSFHPLSRPHISTLIAEVLFAFSCLQIETHCTTLWRDQSFLSFFGLRPVNHKIADRKQTEALGLAFSNCYSLLARLTSLAFLMTCRTQQSRLREIPEESRIGKWTAPFRSHLFVSFFWSNAELLPQITWSEGNQRQTQSFPHQYSALPKSRLLCQFLPGYEEQTAFLRMFFAGWDTA